MSVTYGFYNSLNGDRKYDATQLSSLFDGLITDGIFASIGTCFVVKAYTGNTVNVGIGKAWFNKTWTLNDAVLPLEAPTSEVLLDRIDAVVIEVDTSEAVRANSIKFVKGVPSSSPVNPTLASGPTLNQYPLCYIYRPAGSSEITQAQITNMVGSEATPFVTGILQTINIDELLSQWEDEYEEWFQELVDILDDNAAANLLNLINEHKAENATDAHQINNIEGLQETLQNKGKTFTTTLNTTWSGSSAPFTKTQTVNGILATDNPIVDVEMSGTFATDEARAEAWGHIYRITTANNSITLYAKEKPTVELPIQLKVVR